MKILEYILKLKNQNFIYENGKDISKIVLEILTKYGYSTKDDQCILQCFDTKELERIRKKLNSDLFLVQLMESSEQQSQLPALCQLCRWYWALV